MTQDELDALPEDSGPLCQTLDDYFAIEDRQGRVWMTGWAMNVRYKKRMRSFEREAMQAKRSA